MGCPKRPRKCDERVTERKPKGEIIMMIDGEMMGFKASIRSIEFELKRGSTRSSVQLHIY